MPSPEIRLAVLGDPVSHSLSPAMHEAALREAELVGSYERIRVSRSQLASLVGQLRRKGYGGFNVTIPHKEAVLDAVQTVDDRAHRIGAVNTISRVEGGFRGYNTDASGFARVIGGLHLPLGNALVLGAGGAARACIDALTEMGWRVTVANRSLDRARTLPAKTNLVDLKDARVVQQVIDTSELMVNTTPVGMNHPDESPLLHQVVLPQTLTVADLVYVPLETRLLYEAREAGCRTVDGLGFLAAQAADAFEIWTGKRLVDGFFRQAALEGALMTRALAFRYGEFAPP